MPLARLMCSTSNASANTTPIATPSSTPNVFERVGLTEVLSYTAPDNVRSQWVMERLGLRRDPSCDFSAEYDQVGRWRGLVWVRWRSM